MIGSFIFSLMLIICAAQSYANDLRNLSTAYEDKELASQVALLISKNADVDAIDPRTGYSPMQIAEMKKNEYPRVYSVMHNGKVQKRLSKQLYLIGKSSRLDKKKKLTIKRAVYCQVCENIANHLLNNKAF